MLPMETNLPQLLPRATVRPETRVTGTHVLGGDQSRTGAAAWRWHCPGTEGTRHCPGGTPRTTRWFQLPQELWRGRGSSCAHSGPVRGEHTGSTTEPRLTAPGWLPAQG